MVLGNGLRYWIICKCSSLGRCMRESISSLGCTEIGGQVSKGMRLYRMVDWIGIGNCCQCSWRYRYLKRSLNILRFIRVKIGDQTGCIFQKTETRRKAECGSGKALLPLSGTAGRARPWKQEPRTDIADDRLVDKYEYMINLHKFPSLWFLCAWLYHRLRVTESSLVFSPPRTAFLNDRNVLPTLILLSSTMIGATIFPRSFLP